MSKMIALMQHIIAEGTAVVMQAENAAKNKQVRHLATLVAFSFCFFLKNILLDALMIEMKYTCYI